MYAVPQIGSIVTVTVKQTERYYYATDEFRYTTYEDLPVLRSEKWDPPNTFRVPALNEKYLKERVISMNCVSALSINGHSATGHAPNTNIQFINVKGSKNNEYVVTVEGKVAKSCTCIGFQYRRMCKHIQEVTKLLT